MVFLKQKKPSIRQGYFFNIRLLKKSCPSQYYRTQAQNLASCRHYHWVPLLVLEKENTILLTLQPIGWVGPSLRLWYREGHKQDCYWQILSSCKWGMEWEEDMTRTCSNSSHASWLLFIHKQDYTVCQNPNFEGWHNTTGAPELQY